MINPPPSAAHPPARLYAIGDIHGRLDLLDRLLAEMDADAKRFAAAGGRCITVFLGDYVDRGPDSRGVIERLVSLPRGGPMEWVFLEGNHEAAMRAFMAAPERNGGWLDYGGDAALLSYGVAPVTGARSPAALHQMAEALEAALPAAHRRFLYDLDTHFECGTVIFAHAGLRPGVRIEAQSRQDLLSIREPFLSKGGPAGRLVIHGHTVTADIDFGPGRIGIDTGAYASDRLSCLVLDGGAIASVSTRPEGGVEWRHHQAGARP